MLRPKNAVTRRRRWQLGRTTLLPAAAAASPRSWRVRRATLARFARRPRWSTLAVQYRWSHCRRADDTRADGSRVCGEAMTIDGLPPLWDGHPTPLPPHGLGEKLGATMHREPQPWTGREARCDKRREPQSTRMVLAALPADQLTTPERAESAWTRGSVGHRLWSRRMHLDATWLRTHIVQRDAVAAPLAESA